MQWETVPSELNGDQEFLHGMHDMLSNRCVTRLFALLTYRHIYTRWDGVHYRRDHRSRREKFQQTWAHWQPLLPSLTDALIKWKNIPAAEPLPPEANEPEDEIEDEPFEIYTVDLYTLHDTTIIHRKPTTEASIALVQNGYLGASPLVPTLAISLKTLKLYRRLRLRKPSFSYEAFTKVLCDLYNVSVLYLFAIRLMKVPRCHTVSAGEMRWRTPMTYICFFTIRSTLEFVQRLGEIRRTGVFSMPAHPVDTR